VFLCAFLPSWRNFKTLQGFPTRKALAKHFKVSQPAKPSRNTSRFPNPQSPCETLEGFPNPQSPCETLEGFPNPQSPCETLEGFRKPSGGLVKPSGVWSDGTEA